MIICVFGTRTFSNYDCLCRAMPWRVMDVKELVSGAAHGADELGEYWAHSNFIPVRRFVADWAGHGKVAGPIRNQQMAEYLCRLAHGGPYGTDPHQYVHAYGFWDGESNGTRDMIARLQYYQIESTIIRYKEEKG